MAPLPDTDHRALILIESSGSRDRLREIVGLPVFATGGHIWRDVPLGEAPVFDREGMARRIPRHLATMKALWEILSRPWEALLIGTDPDDEGDVIAADLVAMARTACPRAALFRVHWQTMEKEAVHHALGQATEINPLKDPPLGAAGLARATIDRILIEQAQRVPGGGRVAGPLLDALARSSLPAGPPRLAFDRPWTLRDLLVMGRGADTGQRYALAESLYLSGHLSYPRTAAQGYWPETQAILVDRAPLRSTQPLPLSLPLSAPHEALWATGPILLDTHPDMLSAPDAVLASVMAAAWVSQGIVPPEDMPAPPAPATGIDARLVDWQAREGLGRPSTWAQRAMAFCERGWATPEGALAPEGARVHQKVPEPLRDAAFSRAIEAHIADKAAEGWDALAIVRSAFARFSPDLVPPPSHLCDRSVNHDVGRSGHAVGYADGDGHPPGRVEDAIAAHESRQYHGV